MGWCRYRHQPCKVKTVLGDFATFLILNLQNQEFSTFSENQKNEFSTFKTCILKSELQGPTTKQSPIYGTLFFWVSGGACSTRKLKKYMINTNYNYPTMHNKHKLCLPCSLAYYETFHYNQLERFTHLLLWQ